MAGEQQTLVLRGIQVILLVRLVALVSNRPSALGLLPLSISLGAGSSAPPSLKHFSWALVRPAHELLLANKKFELKTLAWKFRITLSLTIRQQYFDNRDLHLERMIDLSFISYYLKLVVMLALLILLCTSLICLARSRARAIKQGLWPQHFYSWKAGFSLCLVSARETEIVSFSIGTESEVPETLPR